MGTHHPDTTVAHRHVAEWLDSHSGELIALRRHLHTHPEPSGRETATTELLAERLAAAGLEPKVLDRGTGLVCDVGGGPPTIALRADIDGLEMHDDKDVPYRSRNDGVAHACGHDAHTALVLGAGLSLASLLETSDTGVRLLFEPAEEQVPGGAVDVISEGGLEGIASVYALHCDPKLPVGTIGTRRGAITSAADQVFVELSGPGGHTARPHLTVDLVRWAARASVELPDLVSQRTGGEVLLVFGTLRAGHAPNVIPTTAHLGGSLRTPDRALWDDALDILTKATAEVLEGSGAEWRVDHRRGVPPVVNHDRETGVLERAISTVLGPGGRVDTPRSAGGDSYAWYLERTGGTFGRLGTHAPDNDTTLDLHRGSFDIDERAIGIGAAVLAAAVLHELGDRLGAP